jgi:hypothetical protein
VSATREPIIADQAVQITTIGSTDFVKVEGLSSIEKLDIYNDGPANVFLEFFSVEREQWEPAVGLTLRPKRFYSFPGLRAVFGQTGVSGFRIHADLAGAVVDWWAWKENEWDGPLPATVSG